MKQFDPKQDITAYEVALLLKAHVQPGVPEWFVASLPPELERHFKEVGHER